MRTHLCPCPAPTPPVPKFDHLSATQEGHACTCLLPTPNISFCFFFCTMAEKKNCQLFFFCKFFQAKKEPHEGADADSFVTACLLVSRSERLRHMFFLLCTSMRPLPRPLGHWGGFDPNEAKVSLCNVHDEGVNLRVIMATAGICRKGSRSFRSLHGLIDC